MEFLTRKTNQETVHDLTWELCTMCENFEDCEGVEDEEGECALASDLRNTFKRLLDGR